MVQKYISDVLFDILPDDCIVRWVTWVSHFHTANISFLMILLICIMLNLVSQGKSFNLINIADL